MLNLIKVLHELPDAPLIMNIHEPVLPARSPGVFLDDLHGLSKHAAGVHRWQDFDHGRLRHHRCIRIKPEGACIRHKHRGIFRLLSAGRSYDGRIVGHGLLLPQSFCFGERCQISATFPSHFEMPAPTDNEAESKHEYECQGDTHKGPVRTGQGYLHGWKKHRHRIGDDAPNDQAFSPGR